MLDKLEKYYQDGLLFKQTHPTLDLTIWNYTPKVQFERLWDEITLSCRGLVTNSEGIVARPFKKFFNYEEYPIDIIPFDLPFEVFQKMDGSLGIYFNYKDEWIMATRGSFTSPQAMKGLDMMIKNYNWNLNPDYTFLFEIIYPENRIVCEYGDEQLVLLGAIRNSSGDEMDYQTLEHYSKVGKFPLVKKWNITKLEYDILKKQISDDEEGVVVRFSNGFRMKIKGEEYCRLHRILTNVSSRNIWEYLKEGKPFDELLEKVPDEFYDWVKKTVAQFEEDHVEIMGIVIEDFWEIHKKLDIEDDELDVKYNEIYEKQYSKRYAEEAFKKRYPHLLFSYRKEILNPIRTSQAIWDMLYPDFVKPFKKDE